PIEESTHLGGEDADRTGLPTGPTNREALHGSLTDLAGPCDRGLEARSLHRVDGRAAEVVVRIRKIAHSTTHLRLDRRFRICDLLLHLHGLGSREDRMGERMGAKADAEFGHAPALLPGEHHSLIRSYRQVRLEL